MAFKGYYFYTDSKLKCVTVDESRLDEAALKFGVAESEFIETTPLNEIKNYFMLAYSIVSGSLEFDLNVAKNIKKNRLREARKILFKKTDAEYIRAIQQSNTTAQADLDVKAQNLRDFPVSSEWDALTTADEVDGFIPASFSAVE